MEQEVISVIAKVFSTPISEIDRETTAADVNGWDSLSHTFLLSAIEEKFDIRFDPFSVGSFSCVGDMIDEIERLKA